MEPMFKWANNIYKKIENHFQKNNSQALQQVEEQKESYINKVTLEGSELSLPCDLAENILINLTLVEVVKTFTVSKHWYRIAKSNELWQKLIKDFFPHINSFENCNIYNYQTFLNSLVYLYDESHSCVDNSEQAFEDLMEINDKNELIISEITNLISHQQSFSCITKGINNNFSAISYDVCKQIRKNYFTSQIKLENYSKMGDLFSFNFCKKWLFANYSHDELIILSGLDWNIANENSMLETLNEKNCQNWCFPIVLVKEGSNQ